MVVKALLRKDGEYFIGYVVSLYFGVEMCAQKRDSCGERSCMYRCRSGKSVPLSLFCTLIAGSAELGEDVLKANVVHRPIVSVTGSWPCAA